MGIDLGIAHNDMLSNFSPLYNCINLGYEIKYAYDFLSNEDFDLFLSDVIIHEFMHFLLNDMFNSTICRLFDNIEYLFCENHLLEKVFKYIRVKRNSDYPMTWYSFIKKDGFGAFKEEYHISEYDMKIAKDTSNRRP